ncbi:hypothetical protein CQW23_33955 [Capsicum baccatum]|uniref:Calmodulin-binding domain-containing protein n=1 Tax=Capsicum baccatum TaxID=33114 RepID=A0A2G2V0L4_CAPBA|nr:hypothetical protein CQW23_33955 [Capsicum baccatum]
MPETEKKMKSSSKILGGVDAGGKKDSVGNYRKQIIAPKVSTEKSLKTPTLSSPPNSSSVNPLILRDVQEKKDVQDLLNNVIEEMTSKLVKTGKSKVKTLVGAFETVISLHNKPSAIIFS